jgi:hypothetical protein
MSNISVTNAVRTILLENEDIEAKLKHTDNDGNVTYNIFPLFAPDGTDGDFIIYKRDGFDLERSKMGISQENCKIIMNVVSDKYDESQSLAELVYKTLEHSFKTPLKITIQLTDSLEDVDTIKDTSGTTCIKYTQILYFSIKNNN